ncbi:pPIWI_RE module domain-containing protein [Streptomyces goshikiensis]
MYTFALPAEWKQPLLELRRAGLTEREAAWHRTVPTQAVNQLMRATAPDIVTVDGTATFGSQSPWLYCEQEYPMSVMNTYIAAWLRNLGKNPDDPAIGARLMDTFRDLGPTLPHWQLGMVDLLEQDLSPGGTAQPANHVYRLLPEVMAGRIERQEPYEHNGERLMFRRVAQLPGARGIGSGGAELMSWPPRKIESGKAPSYYAARITITVRTSPFSPVPRVHLATGIRRFVTGKVWMPYQKGVSVYLLPDTSLVPDGLSSPAFSVATIRWRNGTTDWSLGGVQGMLGYVTALDALPSVDRLVKEADHWIGGRDGLTLAVGHQAAMGAHPVGTGLMPSERRRLTEWAEQALAPELVPVPLLARSRYAGPPKRQLQPLPSVPKEEKKPGDLAAASESGNSVSPTTRSSAGPASPKPSTEPRSSAWSSTRPTTSAIGCSRLRKRALAWPAIDGRRRVMSGGGTLRSFPSSCAHCHSVTWAHRSAESGCPAVERNTSRRSTSVAARSRLRWRRIACR